MILILIPNELLEVAMKKLSLGEHNFKTQLLLSY